MNITRQIRALHKTLKKPFHPGCYEDIHGKLLRTSTTEIRQQGVNLLQDVNYNKKEENSVSADLSTDKVKINLLNSLLLIRSEYYNMGYFCGESKI
jgi:hypothetical protein